MRRALRRTSCGETLDYVRSFCCFYVRIILLNFLTGFIVHSKSYHALKHGQVKGSSTNFSKLMHKWLIRKQSHSERLGVECSVLEKRIGIVNSGGDRNQTSEEFKASDGSLTGSYYTKWPASSGIFALSC